MTKFVVSVPPSHDGAVRVHVESFHAGRDEWTRLALTQEIEAGQESELEVDIGGFNHGKPRPARRIVIEEV